MAGWRHSSRRREGDAPTDRINAGVYVLERDVIEGIPAGRAVSFEREVFPALVGDGPSSASGRRPYWIDIGTPERYLEATWDLLAGRVPSSLPARDETGSLILGGSLVAGAHVGPQSVLGRSCSVGTDARVERAVLHDRVIVGADASVRESVLAEHVRVGAAPGRAGAMVGAGATVGDGATVGEGARLDPGAVVEPGGQVAPGHTVAAGAA